MNRKLVGALAMIAAVLGFVVWFVALRDQGEPQIAPPPKAAGSAAPTPVATPDKAEPAPPGMAPRWQLDVDPEGSLRLEGQVVDDHGDPVGGAIVMLGSVPPRTTTSEDDGSFAFDKLVGRTYTLTATAGEMVGGPIRHALTETSDPAVIRVIAGAKVVVTVVDPDGRPVSDATVRLAAMHDVTAQTASDGTATIKPVQPGFVAVQVTADGYAPGNGFTQVGGAGATGQVKVTLRKGVAVSGRVIDELGKPVKGARVTTAGVWDLPGGLAPIETDAKGRFTFAAIAPGTHTFIAVDGEHAPARSAPVTVEDRPVDNVELVMQAGGVLAGMVVDAANAPVPYATVRIAGDGQQMWMVQSRQVTADKTGAFEVSGLPRTQLQARAEAEAAASSIAKFDLTTEREKRDVRLVLDVKGTIAGIVVDETGAAVPEVQVNAFPDFLDGNTADGFVLAGMSSATTDGDGRFTVRGLPEGSYRLRAARAVRGYFDWGAQGTQAKTGDTNVKITLAAPGTVVGKLVIDGASAPPALANVQIGSQPAIAANKDGTFEIPDVTPGSYDLHVRGPEFATFTRRDVTVESGKPTDVGMLTLVRGRKITGRVIDRAGNAVPGAKVKSGDMLYSVQGAEEQLETLEELAGMRSAVSDQDGRFTLIAIGKKRTSLMADHATRGRSAAVEIPEGVDDPPPVTLQLRGYGSLAGKVTSQGKPVGGVTITATPKGGGAQVQIAQSEADGSFKLAKIAEGTTIVSAMQQNALGMSLKSTSVTVEVAADKQTTVNIDIPVGTITLAVEVKPLPNHTVDSAQVFLFRGVVAMQNAKELTDAFLAGGVQGMKFWLGAGKPVPEFEELVAGSYSVCTIPITGDLGDMKLQQRIQANMAALAVYCKQVKVTPSPNKQSVVHEVPTMSPIPEN